MTRLRPRLARRRERGTAVVVIVLVTTLITAIGIFAVRNVSQVDLAVGYSRQSTQANAVAELGTTAAMAQIGALGNYYSELMSTPSIKCLANGRYATASSSTCYHLDQADLEQVTTSNGGETLLEPTASGETGSLGPLANTTANIRVEMTEKHQTNTPIPGSSGSAYDVTLTTTAAVTPISGTADPCAGVAGMAVRRVMRSHVILPPN